MVGVVTLSVELELGWGKHDMGVYAHLSDDRSAEDTALARLLELCDARDIPITFDVVGHLYHEACSGEHPGPYSDSWWDSDPGTSRERDPQFYAPELLKNIRDRETEHEICTHTYSHVLANRVPDTTLRHELRTVSEIHDEWGLAPPASIIMPRHHSVDYELLSEYGIETIRRPIDDYGTESRTRAGKFWWLLTRDHPECTVQEVDGIVETTCTPHPSLAGMALPTGQNPSPAYFRVIPRSIRESMHRQYVNEAIDMAADRGSHVHLWTHLYNIANDSQWRAIEPAMHQLADRRDGNDIEIRRMRELRTLLE